MKQVWLLLCCLLLTSCGFHWAPETRPQSGQKDIAVICKDTTPYLCRKFKNTLLQRGYHLQPNASLRLTLLHSEIEQDLSPLKTTEKRRYYDLLYHLSFILEKNKRTYAKAETITVENAYIQNENQILASNRQLTRDQQELEDRVIERVLLRLEHL